MESVYTDTLPPRNGHFVGREAELTDISSFFTEPKIVNFPSVYFLVGKPEIGKTEIAIEYAHRYNSNHSHIFWISQDQGMEFTFSRIMHTIGLGQSDTAETNSYIPTPLMNWLQSPTNSRWLLVLDNVGLYGMTIRELGAYIPNRGNGSVIITARFPDQLRQVAGTEAWKVRWKTLQELNIRDEFRRATFKKLFSILKRDEQPFELLSMLSFLRYPQINVDLLQSSFAQVPLLEESLRLLWQNSLIYQENTDLRDSFRMHPLTRECLLAHLGQAEKLRAIKRALELLGTAARKEITSLSIGKVNSLMLKNIKMHAEAISRHLKLKTLKLIQNEKDTEKKSEDVATLCENIARVLEIQGYSSEAEFWCARAFAIAVICLGVDWTSSLHKIETIIVDLWKREKSLKVLNWRAALAGLRLGANSIDGNGCKGSFSSPYGESETKNLPDDKSTLMTEASARTEFREPHKSFDQLLWEIIRCIQFWCIKSESDLDKYKIYMAERYSTDPGTLDDFDDSSTIRSSGSDFSGTTLAGITPDQMEIFTSQVSTILLKNIKLQIKEVTDFREFRSHISRSLVDYIREIQTTAQEKIETNVVRFLKYRRRQIANEMCKALGLEDREEVWEKHLAKDDMSNNRLIVEKYLRETCGPRPENLEEENRTHGTKPQDGEYLMKDVAQQELRTEKDLDGGALDEGALDADEAAELNSIELPRIQQVEAFLVQGKPFANLVESIRMFLTTKESSTRSSRAELELYFPPNVAKSISELPFGLNRSFYLRLLWSTLKNGFELTKPAYGRKYWICHCGTEIFHDINSKPRNFGNSAGFPYLIEAKFNCSRIGQILQCITGVFRPPKPTPPLPVFSQASCGQTNLRPSSNDPNALNQAIGASSSNIIQVPDPINLKYSLFYAPGSSQLQSIALNDTDSDHFLFSNLIRRHQELYPKWRRLLSLRNLYVELFRFRLVHKGPVGVVHGQNLELSPTINISDPEYDILYPELFPNQLLHFIQNPDHLVLDNGTQPREVQKRIPLKRNSIPVVDSQNFVLDGWGIHLQAKITSSSIWLGAAIAILSSFIIAIVWSVVTGDPQTGFTVGGYTATVITVVVAMGTLQTAIDEKWI